MKPRLAQTSETAGQASPTADPIQSLYENHAVQVKRWARRLAGPSADLEDLVQDIFLIALKKGFHCQTKSLIDTWLFRITLNVIRGKRRRSQLRSMLLGRHEVALAPSAPPQPQHQLEQREQALRLYQLPDRYRTILILYEIEELPGEEVAELTGTNIGTVWVRLHRGRERLLRLLEQEGRP